MVYPLSRRGPFALGAVFVLGGLILALAAGSLQAQDFASDRPGDLAAIERRLKDLEGELTSLRRSGGSTHDLRRVQRQVDRERTRLRELRESASREARARRETSGTVPLDGQPVTIGIDTDQAPAPRRERVERRTANWPAPGGRDDVVTRTPAAPPRDNLDADIARLREEIQDLRARWESTSDGATMSEAERERVSGRLEKARDQAEELMLELRIADQSGLGARHPHVLGLREELAMAEARISSLQQRLTAGSTTRRQELAEQIEQRLARLDRLKGRLTVVAEQPRGKPESRGRLASRVEQLGKAVDEVRALLQRHRVDEHRVVAAMQEVDRRRGEARLPRPQSPPRGVHVFGPAERPAVTPALQAQIAELRARVDAVNAENHQLRQHADALRQSLAEHNRMREELERRGRPRQHPAGTPHGRRAGHAGHTGHAGRGAPAHNASGLQAENVALRKEADQLRQQLGALRAEYERLRRGTYMR